MCMGGGSNQIGPTADQVAQADINQKMWEHYQTNFKPVLNKYIASRTDPNTTKQEKAKVTGQINADVMKAARPQSPTNAVVNAKNMMAVTDVKADAETKGELGVEARQIGTEENIINIGRGQTTKAMSGMDELASMSVQKAIQDKAREEQVAAMEENAIGSAVGTVAAAGAYGAMKKKPKIMSDAPGGGVDNSGIMWEHDQDVWNS